MNKLLNILLSGLLWRRYKFLLVSLIGLIVFIFLSGQIHQDYLAYAQSNESVSVGWSFALKWLAWIVAVIIFFMLNNWHNNKKQLQADANDKNSTLQRILKWKRTHPEDDAKQHVSAKKRTNQQPLDSNEASERDANDPFAHLRDKTKLRTYADMIIEKKESEVKKDK
jgi:uncharacterized membrane protein